jgi:hypothetical protein
MPSLLGMWRDLVVGWLAKELGRFNTAYTCHSERSRGTPKVLAVPGLL